MSQRAYRIYDGYTPAPRLRAPRNDVERHEPTIRSVAVSQVQLSPLPKPRSDELVIRVFESPAESASVEAEFRRKEERLRAIFASLERREADLLYERLGGPREGDVVAKMFARLTLERRTRLLEALRNRGRYGR